MLLLHQVGSVKLGEVVRYTVTYTPSQDRILPSPEKLHVRIRNTSAIALRAAFVHGPYNLCVAAYPAAFNPNVKFQNPRRYGVPEFEPMVKAGGSWQCELVVPEHIRQSAGTGSHGHFGAGPDHEAESASWIIEVSSQVIFSTSASVGYEVVLARDEKSLNLNSLPVIGGQAKAPQPGKVSDLVHHDHTKDGHRSGPPKGVFSRAITLKVEDTATLWNTPRLPGWDNGSKILERGKMRPPKEEAAAAAAAASSSSSTTTNHKNTASRVATPGPPHSPSSSAKLHGKPKKVHLVVLTHGLHSNLGADLLYLKESIDATVRQAKVDAKARRAKDREARRAKAAAAKSGSAEHEGQSSDVPETSAGSEDDDEASEDEEDEEVIVRGFSGNATRTERGIKFLGKRLARYILSTCYPDQPFLPSFKGAAEVAANSIKPDHEGKTAHKHSSIHKEEIPLAARPFKITSISFIGHSLGGLIQTYAVAYVQKHSPRFFDLIKPINFVTLATPFLGLSNENPLYVKFALDFGLVGRTGQDLGLTWRAPTIARSGWGAIVSNLGESAHKKVIGESRPESKPLLRILPTGPAHTALKKFRNRTVYSNVVNDGIVPLRTSCLLFLDWQGLGRVEKARRDAGLVETLVGAGWAELTGANVGSARREARQLPPEDNDEGSGTATPTAPQNAAEVPQPGQNAIVEDDNASLRSVPTPYQDDAETTAPKSSEPSNNGSGPFAGFFNFFKSHDPPAPTSPTLSPKQNKIYRRSQTIKFDDSSTTSQSSGASKVTSGQEFENDTDGMNAPPRTTFFESAHDLINPTLPSTEFVVDPSKRPRAIFHDRVYHPSDIPPPPLKKKSSSGSLVIRRRNTGHSTASTDTKDHAPSVASSLGSSPRTPSQGVGREDSLQSTKDYDDTTNTNPNKDEDQEIDGSQMRVEEKIARAYHRGMAWRKVLVKLEPDAHNNIIVRRMFANAFGWPVVKHLVDAHFSDSATVRMRVDEEGGEERAFDMGQPPDQYGGEVKRSNGNDGAGGTSTHEKPPHEETSAQRTARKEQEGREGENLAREAEDKVTALPRKPEASSPVAATAEEAYAPKQRVSRADSMTWSDGDWADTDGESDVGTEAGGRSPRLMTPDGKGKDVHGSWNWTEKIVGKGPATRSASGQQQQQQHLQPSAQPPPLHIPARGKPVEEVTPQEVKPEEVKSEEARSQE
ncbi:hypothetical protein VD0004_g7016 [Verticillium dahliae]|nr:hypothetical protein VD0004_g7016 [Verticillium dahliae]PNH71593.1 hypothetical protein VD0001_g5947 [Verticillium dahliae]